MDYYKTWYSSYHIINFVGLLETRHLFRAAILPHPMNPKFHHHVHKSDVLLTTYHEPKKPSSHSYELSKIIDLNIFLPPTTTCKPHQNNNLNGYTYVVVICRSE